MRGLRALGVPSSSYGGLLSSILISKLPPELCLIISRELMRPGFDDEDNRERGRSEKAVCRRVTATTAEGPREAPAYCIAIGGWCYCACCAQLSELS